MCPLLLRRLWRLLKVVWRKGDDPASWKEAEGIFKPKVAVAETRGDKLEAINQRAVIDHHCGPTRYQSVHVIGPKHSGMAGSMMMMLVEEQSTT